MKSKINQLYSTIKTFILKGSRAYVIFYIQIFRDYS